MMVMVMYLSMHEHCNAHMRAHFSTHTHTHLNTHTHTNWTHKYIHTHTYTHNAHTHTHTYTHTHTHTHTHTQTHTVTHTHNHTHTHWYTYWYTGSHSNRVRGGGMRGVRPWLDLEKKVWNKPFNHGLTCVDVLYVCLFFVQFIVVTFPLETSWWTLSHLIQWWSRFRWRIKYKVCQACFGLIWGIMTLTPHTS